MGRDYLNVDDDTERFLPSVISGIIVQAPAKASGHRRQKIQTIWNFVGGLQQDEDKQSIER